MGNPDWTDVDECREEAENARPNPQAQPTDEDEALIGKIRHLQRVKAIYEDLRPRHSQLVEAHNALLKENRALLVTNAQLRDQLLQWEKKKSE